MHQAACAAVQGHAAAEGPQERAQVPRTAARGLREPPESRQVEERGETPAEAHRPLQDGNRTGGAADCRRDSAG